MPLMMDEEMDVDIDDLFGDGTGLSLQSRPPPKELYQRIDELRGSGCCQGIAWSKWGHIAYINSTGDGLQFRSLKCSPRDGSWGLCDPPELAKITLNTDGLVVQHLSWSPNGSDLAAIDSAGRVSIVHLGLLLEKPDLVRPCQMDPLDDLNAVVGGAWLNLLPQRQANSSLPLIQRMATKVDKVYRYDRSQAIAFGSCYPNPQISAFVCITTNGVMRLVFPQGDKKWYETTSEIESVVSSDDLITHASICADRGSHLLVAFATTTKHLQVVRVTIKWGNKPEKTSNPTTVMVNPSITIKHLAATNWMDCHQESESQGFHTSTLPLSHLRFFSSSPDGPGGQPTLPSIMIVRSHLPASSSQFNQDTHSVVDRWELRESTPAVHPAFEQLSSRRNNTGTQPGNIAYLHKDDNFTVNKVVVSISSISHDTIICFGYSDGSIEYRDRVTLAELFMIGNLDKFSHLSQVGLNIEDDEPCLQMELSLTSCSAVKLGCNGKLRWKCLSYQMGQLTDATDEAQYNGILAGLSMACGTSIMNTSNYDDLIAIARNATSMPNFPDDWLTELCRSLNFLVDYSDESHNDNLIRNPAIQLFLGIQNSLASKGEAEPRAFGAKLAWIGLQCRNCVVLMTMAVSMKLPDKATNRVLSGLEDAECVRFICGSIRWCLDLMSYLIDSLIFPSDAKIFESLSAGSATAEDLNTLYTRLQASNNITLHILLSSATRAFLTSICRRLTHLDYTARKAMSAVAQTGQNSGQNAQAQAPISADLRTAYTAIATLTSGTTVSIRTFETLLNSISASVKEAYNTAGLPHNAHQQPGPRHPLELTMLFGGPLPAQLLPTMKLIFTTLLPTLKANIRPDDLWFHNFDMLGLDARDSKNLGKAKLIDIFTRNEILLNHKSLTEDKEVGMINLESGIREAKQEVRKFRSCARCAAVMEEIPCKGLIVAAMVTQQRRCFCGGAYVVLTERELLFGP